MKDLGKWQIISFISRVSATLVGIMQSLLLLRILSVYENGVVRIVLSAGALFGAFQNLGLTSASTREISLAKDKSEVSKIFFTALSIRYLIAIPLFILVFINSDSIAATYKVPEISLLIKIFSLTFLVQAAQSISNTLLSGTGRFKQLFTLQITTAIISILIYIPLVYFYKTTGYFYALVLHGLIVLLITVAVSLWPYRKELKLPNLAEYKRLAKELFSISIALYIVKILYSYWENSGPNLLKLVSLSTVVDVSIFGFGMLYAKKLLTISDSVTDVNLAVFSQKYSREPVEFVKDFQRNFNKVFFFILLVALTSNYWRYEIVWLFNLVIARKDYFNALPLIPPILLAYCLYSFIDIFKSSIFVPAKTTLSIIISYTALLAGTAVTFLVAINFLNLQSTTIMAYSLLSGAAFGLLSSLVLAKRKLNIWILGHEHVLILLQVSLVVIFANFENFILKSVAFLMFLILYLWAVQAGNLVDYKQLWQQVFRKKVNLAGK